MKSVDIRAGQANKELDECGGEWWAELAEEKGNKVRKSTNGGNPPYESDPHNNEITRH